MNISAAAKLPSSGTNVTGIAVGVSVGGLLLLALIIALVAIICR